MNRAVAARDGAILPIQARCPEALAAGDLYDPAGLVEEVTTTINTAAAGGNRQPDERRVSPQLPGQADRRRFQNSGSPVSMPSRSRR